MGKAGIRADRPAREAWQRLVQLITDTDSRRDLLLEQLGLTAGDSRALSSLDRQKVQSIGSLASEWQCDASTATRAVDRLEERGLAERRSISGDRRVRLVALTPQGVRVKAKLIAGRLRPPPELTAMSGTEIGALLRALRPLRGPHEHAPRRWEPHPTGLEIRTLLPGDENHVLAAASLFSNRPQRRATERSLLEPGHHLLVAYQDATPAGFILGIEQTQPDKGTEMFVAELAVDQKWRGRGIGRHLVAGLTAIARERRCYGMWALTGVDNASALATYGRAGASSRADQVMLLWKFD